MLYEVITIQLTMFLLVCMSVLSWTVVFTKYFTLRRINRECAEEYEAFQQAGDIAGAMKNMSQTTAVYQVGHFAP